MRPRYHPPSDGDTRRLVIESLSSEEVGLDGGDPDPREVDRCLSDDSSAGWTPLAAAGTPRRGRLRRTLVAAALLAAVLSAIRDPGLHAHGAQTEKTGPLAPPFLPPEKPSAAPPAEENHPPAPEAVDEDTPAEPPSHAPSGPRPTEPRLEERSPIIAAPSLVPEFPRVDDHVDEDRWLQERERDPEPLVLAAGVGLWVPNFLVEGLAWLVTPERVVFNGQVLYDRSGGSPDFVDLFVRQLVRRETSFFAGIGNTELATVGVELGEEDVDASRFHDHQVRILFDSFKRTYRERFHMLPLDLDTAIATVSTGEWVDALLVPAAISVYAARFGIDRKFKFSDDIRLTLHMEEGNRAWRALVQDSHHHLGTASLNLFRLPVSVICDLEGNAGKFEFSFVGIGTDAAAVYEAVRGADAHRSHNDK